MTQSLTAFQIAVGLFQQGLAKEARALCTHRLAQEPRHADWLHLAGVIANQVGDYPQAIAMLEAAIAVQPDNAHFHNSLGNAFKGQGALQAALSSHEQAIALMPEVAEFHYNRALIHELLNRVDEALAGYGRAIDLKPDYGPAWNNRGKVLNSLQRLDAAVADFTTAIALMPESAHAHTNLAHTLASLKRYDAALHHADKALALAPGLPFAQGHAAYMRAFLCDWAGRPAELTRMRAGLERGSPVISPFPWLALTDDPPLHRRAAEIFVQHTQTVPRLAPPAASRPGARVQLAYLSADFHDHATAHLAAGLFEHHDREQFELTAISFGPDRPDTMHQRLRKAFDRYVDVRMMDDTDVAQLCRSLKIDVAIDLKGYTQHGRPGILAERCAPIQMSYLGYPGTMGTDSVDYLVADHTLITEEDLSFYAEKVIWLPHSYQVNDRRRPIAEQTPSRPSCGLPPEAFVFCCFNKHYKITPETFDGWMRILHRVPEAVLWLLQGHPAAMKNLQDRAQASGIAARRLIFAPPLPLPAHLARHRLADLFLDTLPCNAHTTASDALWAGLPVLTLMGRSFAARVAASLLNAAGLPELITLDQQGYEDLAVALALNRARFHALRTRLHETRLECPLFDTERFTRNLESAFMKVMERHWAGLAPDHVLIA